MSDEKDYDWWERNYGRTAADLMTGELHLHKEFTHDGVRRGYEIKPAGPVIRGES